MKLFLCYITFLITVFTVKVAICAEICPTIPKHYQELNCNAVTEAGDDCPSSFKCPDFKTIVNLSKCLVNGKYYNIGDDVPDNQTSPCRVHCKCKSYTPPAKLECQHLDCAEFFNPPQPECIIIRSKGSCCAEKTICDEAEKEKLATCEFGGTKYYDGQSMYSDEYPCYTCQCSPSFNATDIVNNPNCALSNCGIELDINRFVDGCVPIYFGKKVCCPIDWRCPEDSDSIIESKSKSDQDHSDLTCDFGKLKLKVGDSLTSERSNLKCSCITPPFVHCEETRN